jgi:hypothetical protein
MEETLTDSTLRESQKRLSLSWIAISLSIARYVNIVAPPEFAKGTSSDSHPFP